MKTNYLTAVQGYIIRSKPLIDLSVIAQNIIIAIRNFIIHDDKVHSLKW